MKHKVNWFWSLLEKTRGENDPRHALTGFYYDASRKIVTTDGRALFCVERNVCAMPAREFGAVYSIEGVNLDVQFPDWEQVIPAVNSEWKWFQLRIPEGLRAKSGTKVSLLEPPVNSDSGYVRVYLGDACKDTTFLACVDLTYLLPFQEAVYHVGFANIDTAKKPVVIAPAPVNSEEELKTLLWFFILMPMKTGK